MTVRVVLVRHGESAWNAERRLTGHTDVPLSARGREQAMALRPRLASERFDGVWSSDLQRAMDTARLAYGEPAPDARLRELDFGELEGLRWDKLPPDVIAAFRSFDTMSAPGGESLADLRTRVVAFLDELQPGRHAVFCHGGVVRAVAAPFGLGSFVGNCAVVEVDWTGSALVSVWEGTA